jgi:hypothetical protein
MNFNKLRLTWGSGAGDTITLALDRMNLVSPYIVQNITGLEPPDLNLVVVTRSDEGGVLTGKRAANREIAILLGFQPQYSSGQTVSDLRRKLYGMLFPKLNGHIDVKLLNDAETDYLTTTAYVKSMDPNIFSKDPQIQIVLSCMSPYFDGIPYTHPSPADLSGKTDFFNITNQGDAPTGFITNVTINAATSFFRFFTEDYVYDFDHARFIHITYQFQIGDKLSINTISGQRYCTMVRSGTTINMLQYLSPNTSWLQLDAGLNRINPNIPDYTITSWKHTPRYWGV